MSEIVSVNIVGLILSRENHLHRVAAYIKGMLKGKLEQDLIQSKITVRIKNNLVTSK